MKEHKIQQLRERYNEYCSNSEDGQGDGMSFAEYVEREAGNDLRFFAWLFDAEDVERFDDLSEEQKKEFKKLVDMKETRIKEMKKEAKFKYVESTECVLYIYFDVDGYPHQEEIPMRFLLNSIGCDSLCEEDVEMFIAQDIEDIEYEYDALIINKEYMRETMRKAYSQYHI